MLAHPPAQCHSEMECIGQPFKHIRTRTTVSDEEQQSIDGGRADMSDPQVPFADARDREVGMFPDELVEKHTQALFDDFLKKLSRKSVVDMLVVLVAKYRGGKNPVWYRAERGSFNTCLVVEMDLDGEDGKKDQKAWAMMRMPIPGASIFPEEKVRAEAAVMRFVAQHSNIPVPRIYHVGTADENPTGLGPFLIMDYYKGVKFLANFLRDEPRSQQFNVLDLALPHFEIQKQYSKMAAILLELDRLPTMPRIGSLSYDEANAKFDVLSRPITQNMAELINSSGFPECVLPPVETTYTTSEDFFKHLANMNMAHLVFQQNRAVISADDARDRYMARHLFRKLAQKGSLTKPASTGGAERFKLFCDDLTPSNVLVDDEGNLVAVIDWEFAYFGPASDDPPWWLLLQKPEYWEPDGEVSMESGMLDDWTAKYPTYLNIFLRALEELEQGNAPEKASGEPLSARMRRNWENGNFWVNRAAREGNGFDPIFWKYIDERFHGKNKRGGYEDRLELSSDSERSMMEKLVKQKMEERSANELVEWELESQQSYLEWCIGQRHV